MGRGGGLGAWTPRNCISASVERDVAANDAEPFAEPVAGIHKPKAVNLLDQRHCVAMLAASKAPPGISRFADGEAWTRCIVPVEAHRFVAT